MTHRPYAMTASTASSAMHNTPPIPTRAQTLAVLRLMGAYRPILMLPGGADGGGRRWLIDGQQVLPGIAKYLMNWGYIAEDGATDLGARRLKLTEAGRRLRDNGLRWWDSLTTWQRLRVIVLG